MPEPLLVLAGVLLAGAFVAWPLLNRAADAAARDDDVEAAQRRHRVALEALRDVEADGRAGALDDEAYLMQHADAEAHAAATGAALESLAALPRARGRGHDSGGARRSALVAAALIGLALVTGSLLPGTGLANQTVVNQALADAQQAEAQRQQRITALAGRLAEDPRDVDALSDLADAHLAGSSRDDLVRAAVALRLLIELEPQRADAYERIITAYLRAGDYVNGRAALDSYRSIATSDPVEVAFFEGLIALRGEGDAPAAARAFERFLEFAPADPRAEMVRRLRDEALRDSGGAAP